LYRLIQEVVAMSQAEVAYWQLVEQLMRFGWYRGGADLERDPSGQTWHFREGQTRDGIPRSELWLAATNEAGAMRMLLDELQQADMARRTGSPAADN
jgi:hypothetical protein